MLGKAPAGRPPTRRPRPTRRSNLYFRCKLVAEQAVDEFLQESALPVVLIRPAWMFGPGDRAPTSSGRWWTLRDEVAWFGRHMPDRVGPAAGRLAALGGV